MLDVGMAHCDGRIKVWICFYRFLSRKIRLDDLLPPGLCSETPPCSRSMSRSSPVGFLRLWP